MATQIVLVRSAPKAGAAREPAAQGSVSFRSLPGTPLLRRATDAHLRSSVTGLIDIGKRSPAVPVTPPYVRVRIRRFGGLSC
jgi:hypothetical protein